MWVSFRLSKQDLKQRPCKINATFKLVVMDSDKFCLRWNEFEENIRHSFKVLRNKESLYDVTLATDDGHQIQAHRIILSAGSDFFSDIFTKCNQSSMLIYLKGIGRKELENITDFLYNGETYVTQEELSSFLEIAQELKVKGLQSSEEETDDSMQSQEANSKLTPKVLSENVDRKLEAKDFNLQKHNDDEVKSNNEPILVSENEPFLVAKNDQSLNEQLNELVERQMGVWKCKVCDKTSNTRRNIKVHVERHIEGVRNTCNVCMKNFSTHQQHQNHVREVHNSKLYSCSGCRKANMNMKAVYNHKRYCNGTSVEQIDML